jgi:hypothetical protein
MKINIVEAGVVLWEKTNVELMMGCDGWSGPLKLPHMFVRCRPVNPASNLL